MGISALTAGLSQRQQLSEEDHLQQETQPAELENSRGNCAPGLLDNPRFSSAY
jgi:hypothetical protein